MSDRITLDEKHGLNPGLDICFYCNEPKGVVLFGKLTGKQRQALKESGLTDGGVEAPRKIVSDLSPCDTCRGHMEQGIILISVRDDSDDPKNPYRTGGWVVVTEDFVRRILEGSPELCEEICRNRFSFMDDTAWDALGLPRSSTS